MSPHVATVRDTPKDRLTVSLDPAKGRVDIREATLMGPGRDPFPTRNGVVLPLADLDPLIDALTQTQRAARELGLIGGAP